MMKFIYGNFSKEQKNDIKKLALQLPDISAESSKYNKKRIDKFIYILENYKRKKEIENLVSSFLFSSINNMPKNYRKKVLSFHSTGYGVVVAVAILIVAYISSTCASKTAKQGAYNIHSFCVRIYWHQLCMYWCAHSPKR